jgi:hypothetical protein
VGADVEKSAGTDLGRPQVRHNGPDIIEVAVVVPDKFAPAVHPLVEIIVA